MELFCWTQSSTQPDQEGRGASAIAAARHTAVVLVIMVRFTLSPLLSVAVGRAISWLHLFQTALLHVKAASLLEFVERIFFGGDITLQETHGPECLVLDLVG